MVGVGDGVGSATVGRGVAGTGVGDGAGEGVGAAVGGGDGDAVGAGRLAVGEPETAGLELAPGAPQAATSTRTMSAATC